MFSTLVVLRQDSWFSRVKRRGRCPAHTLSQIEFIKSWCYPVGTRVQCRPCILREEEAPQYPWEQSPYKYHWCTRGLCRCFVNQYSLESVHSKRGVGLKLALAALAVGEPGVVMMDNISVLPQGWVLKVGVEPANSPVWRQPTSGDRGYTWDTGWYHQWSTSTDEVERSPLNLISWISR